MESTLLSRPLQSHIEQAQPFLKWAGGKTQLLPAIEQRLPPAIRKTGTIKRYVEPFVGGGALFFFLRKKFTIKEAVLIDWNRELILGYRTLQKKAEQLLCSLAEMEKRFLSLDREQRHAFYYSQRQIYNRNMDGFDFENYHPGWIERTTRLIFLNKTCYNGLYRQNRKGEFNVPFGNYARPRIYNPDVIRAVHQALQDTTLLAADFEAAAAYVDKHSLVYFDPPYRPLNRTSNFTRYSSDFDDQEQERLARFFARLDRSGAALILSNSDPWNADQDDDFFDRLYAGYTIERITANRMINSNPAGRGPVSELLITNY